QRLEQVLLAGEVLVEGDAGAPGDGRDAIDAAVVVADLAEHLEGGVEDAQLGALAPRPDLGVVGERGPTHDGVGLALAIAADATGRRRRCGLGALAARSHGRPCARGRTYQARRDVRPIPRGAYASARTWSLRAGTIGGASFQFGMPESSSAIG